MNIEGTYTLQGAGEEVWRHLTGQESLRVTIPGVESIQRVDEGVYDITVAIHYASLKGSYRGRLIFSEQHYPYHYRLNLEKEGGAFSGSGSVNLSTNGHTTIVAYKGTVVNGKSSIQLPQLMMKGTVKLFIQQYFLALAEHLQSEHGTEHASDRAIEDNEVNRRSNIIELATETVQRYEERSAARPTIYSRIVSLFHLGAGDLTQEVEWEQRLKRISIVSSLLFLVWVGTRLPRRK